MIRLSGKQSEWFVGRVDGRLMIVIGSIEIASQGKSIPDLVAYELEEWLDAHGEEAWVVVPGTTPTIVGTVHLSSAYASRGMAVDSLCPTLSN